MPDKSGIHWTDATWNPTTGCHKVSPGCDHCYAEALSLRHGWSAKPWTAPNAAENVVLHPERLDAPLKWRKPRRVFVNSMSDLFHERVPDEFIDRVFAVMALTPQHTYQILTKRSERMRAYITTEHRPPLVEFTAGQMARARGDFDRRVKDAPCIDAFGPWRLTWPMPNVWLGVSAEDQRRADERVPVLLQTPAALRFLSCEPLLGSIDLYRVFGPLTGCGCGCDDESCAWPLCVGQELHWIITGGESGANHRPMESGWARDIRDFCRASRISYFHKQGAGPRPGMHRELDGQIYEEFPQEARS